MTKRHHPAVTVLVVLSVSVVGCGTSPSKSSPPTSSAAATTTTTTASTTTSSPDSATWTAVWPIRGSSIRYQTPEAAAKGFATDYLHMVNPVIDHFQQGDARSGEVPVQPRATGPVTTVLLRQLGSDNSWWVLGAGTAAINLTEPAWNAAITSPVPLKGTAVAFEGNVQTQVRDDHNKPLGAGYVTGGAMEMGPFSGALTFTKATTSYGAVVLYTTSAEDGTVTEASVTRVRFG